MEQSFIPFPVSLQGARQGRVFAMLSFPVAGGIFVSLARGWKELTEANERERSEERAGQGSHALFTTSHMCGPSQVSHGA